MTESIEDDAVPPPASSARVSRPSRPHGIDWRRMLAEGLLIVGSVYLAIYLEGVRDERSRVGEARVALTQLGTDLRQDRRDLGEILADQHKLHGLYLDLERWMGAPGSMPADSVQLALDYIASNNRTMFPRKGAWTTMLSEGYLGALEDPDLIARLGTFYGRINERVEYNGAYYDRSLNQVTGETISATWDPYRGRPFGDSQELRMLRNQLRYMRTAWNEYYVDLLDEYRQELDATIAAVDGYLSK
jgi:hypothetical protein